jgi:hypothetical protein
MEIYRLAMLEKRRGNELISSYIDCAVFANPASSLSIGPHPGQYKVEILDNVWAEQNRIIGEIDGTAQMRAPGHERNSEERLELWRKYNSLRNSPKDC